MPSLSVIVFAELEQNRPNIYTEPKQARNGQGNPEEQKPSRRHTSPRLRSILQSYGKQDSVAKVPKPTHRPLEQKTEPRNKPQTDGQLFFNKGGKNVKGEKTVCSARGAGKLDSHMKIQETGKQHPQTVHKKKLKTA